MVARRIFRKTMKFWALPTKIEKGARNMYILRHFLFLSSKMVASMYETPVVGPINRGYDPEQETIYAEGQKGP